MAAFVVVGCGPPPAHYAAVLDEIALPSSWELAKTEVRAPDGDVDCDPIVNAGCPAVVRYYLVDPVPLVAYAAARAAVTEAGFGLEREFDAEACDAPPSAPACAFFAARGDDRIIVNVYRSGDDDGTGVAQPDRSTVRVTASR